MKRTDRFGIPFALAASLLVASVSPTLAQKLPREHKTLPGIVNPTRGRTFDVQHYRVDVSFDEAQKAVMGTVTITVKPFASGFRQLTLDAVDMRIKSVTVDGRPQKFNSTRNALEVLLDREYAAGADLSVAVTYDCNPRRGIYFVKPTAAEPSAPNQIWSQGEMEENRYWIPSYDFPNDKATSEMIATVPSKYTVVSNGVLVGTTDAPGGMKRWHWRMDKPHTSYLMSIVVSEFATVEDAWDGIPVLYHVYPGREAEGRLAFGKTPKMVQFFSERTGVRYPYPKYSQAVLHDFHFGGMENISATSQTDTTLRTERQRLDGTVDELVAHELAHQWFGDLVTAKDWRSMWLNESFATFFASVWSEKDKGRDAYLLEMRNHQRNYLDEDALRYRRPLVTNVYADPIDVFDAHLYPGGAARLNLLRHVLGEELFWRGINHYLTKFAYQNVETSDFKNALEESTGVELDWFFDDWILRAGVPEFAVSYRYDAPTQRVLMHVEQTQSVTAITPIFSVPVDIVVSTPTGRKLHTVLLDKASQDIVIASDAPPLAVQFDPENYVPKTLDFTRSREELLYVLANGPTAVERSDAADAMASLARDEMAASALAKALAGDADEAVRTSAAKSLGMIGGETAFGALVKALGDARAGVRVAVLGSLAMYPSARVEDLFVTALKNDQSYKVAEAALAGLGRTRSTKGVALFKSTLADATANVDVRGAALKALAESASPGVVEMALSYAKVGQPYDLRAEAYGVLGEYGKGNDAAYTMLATAARSEGYTLRTAALEALIELNDPRAMDVYRATESDDRIDGRLRSLARRGLAGK